MIEIFHCQHGTWLTHITEYWLLLSVALAYPTVMLKSWFSKDKKK